MTRKRPRKNWKMILGVCGMLLTGLCVSAKPPEGAPATRAVAVAFDTATSPTDGLSFGPGGALTFQLYRGGTFLIDGVSGVAWQRSESYRDSALIRSTNPLPDVYKVSIVCGAIDYDLANIAGLTADPRYGEGPPNENGCYLLTITDEPPLAHHTNDWWHLHRKVGMDVDNNVWGAGMPNPIFMIYWDQKNTLWSWAGTPAHWLHSWDSAVHYDKKLYYKVEVEKTATDYNLSVSAENGTPLQRATIPIAEVWHGDPRFYSEYFVVGDPHENYYQGSMKIKSIQFTPRRTPFLPAAPSETRSK